MAGENEPTLAVMAERVKGLSKRLDDHEEVQLREIKSALDATNLARAEMERRLNEMNELRAQINQERNTYATRDALDTRISGVVERIDKLEAANANLQGRLWSMGVAITIFSTVVGWALRFVGR